MTDSAVVDSPRKSGREKVIPDQHCPPAQREAKENPLRFPKEISHLGAYNQQTPNTKHTPYDKQQMKDLKHQEFQVV